MSWNLLLIAAFVSPCVAVAADAAALMGTDANKERLVLDDGEDASLWYNGSPEETNVSASSEHVQQGRFSLKFANIVDHSKGEKNYPVGWPRVGKNLAKAKQTDWSGYDYFECWIYAETSRATLPGVPLGVGFYHSGPKQSTHVPLKQVKKDAWTKIVIPVTELAAPHDVQRVQFNISEADYKHGDRVNFYIDDMVLTRWTTPVVAEFVLGRTIVYASESFLTASYRLAGRRGGDDVVAEFAIGRGSGDPAAYAHVKANRQGELTVAVEKPLTPGIYWARLGLRDRRGRMFDQKTVEFRVVDAPF